MANPYRVVCHTVSDMKKIALGIEYDGSAYNGWQSQKHGYGVQQAVEKAISTVADQEISVICAGRTDTGVHALGQVIHFETTAERSERSWVLGANANLPKDVSVHWAKPVDEHFHARFSALNRRYQYIILNQFSRPAILSRRVTWQGKPLDIERMSKAAASLIGEHDFSSYRAVACQAKSPIRTVHQLSVKQKGRFICIDICANAFLHHMVRNIAGVLMAIGMGEQEIDWAEQVLAHKDRKLGGVTAAPDGLYFMNVAYPEEFAIPEKSGTGLII